MRRCGATKPIEAWVCPLCRNENKENRPFCNSRTCRLAKPGLSTEELAASRTQGGAQGGAGGAPAGSWACAVCGNVNWPQRSTCNGSKGACGAARPDSEASPPAGAWLCSACGNVNWPQRSTCNAKSCGRLRASVDAGAVALAGEVLGLANQPFAVQADGQPRGSWTCAGCGNVNWPRRSTCNGRQGACGLPRDLGLWQRAEAETAGVPPEGDVNACGDVDEGPCARPRAKVDPGPSPTAGRAGAQPVAPEDSWICWI